MEYTLNTFTVIVMGFIGINLLDSLIINHQCSKYLKPKVKNEIGKRLMNLGNPQIDKEFVTGYFKNVDILQKELSISASCISIGLFSIFNVNLVVNFICIFIACYGIQRSKEYISHMMKFIDSANKLLTEQ